MLLGQIISLISLGFFPLLALAKHILLLWSLTYRIRKFHFNRLRYSVEYVAETQLSPEIVEYVAETQLPLALS